VVGVIACLCFSVGEGLRLLPIPASTLGEPALAGCRHPVAAPALDASAQYLSGPVSMPVQKRARREQEPSELVLSRGDEERPDTGFRPRREDGVLSYQLPDCGSPERGRAPPFTA
jgi:hypothetical protein